MSAVYDITAYKHRRRLYHISVDERRENGYDTTYGRVATSHYETRNVTEEWHCLVINGIQWVTTNVIQVYRCNTVIISGCRHCRHADTRREELDVYGRRRLIVTTLPLPPYRLATTLSVNY